jgi:ribonuclease HII
MQKKERELWEKGLTRVAGVDEAGVGCIAGPVVAAAVIFPPGSSVAGLNDSKKLDAATRSELADAIRATTSQIGLGVATVGEIAEHNVYWASILAMKRAVFSLDPLPQFLLIDARPLEDVPIPRESVIHGDSLHCCIAAASIIAKTHRDDLMVELDRRHPEYGFAVHKGYCTKQHEKAIVTHGCCPAHRQSYDYVRQLTKDDNQLSLF